jgi:hypothetical protein
MYVIFPIAQRAALDLRNRYAKTGGFSAVVLKLRLPDGTIYQQEGLWRGRVVARPRRAKASPGSRRRAGWF